MRRLAGIAGLVLLLGTGTAHAVTGTCTVTTASENYCTNHLFFFDPCRAIAGAPALKDMVNRTFRLISPLAIKIRKEERNAGNIRFWPV